MNYLIANAVIYDSEAGLLSSQNNPDSEQKRLTPTANRILRLLIESCGRTVTREELLAGVWESQGQTASNSSLNQYVSILRKTFYTYFELDGVIVSVPRLGFTVPDIISVEVLPTKPDTSPCSNEAAPNDHNVNSSLSLSFPKRGRELFSSFILILSLLIFCGVTYVAWFLRDDTLYDELVEFGHLDKCNLYSYTKLPSNLVNRIMDSLDDIDHTLLSKCKSRDAKVIFFAQRRVYYGELGKIFVSYCPQEGDGAIFYCSNQFFYNKAMR